MCRRRGTTLIEVLVYCCMLGLVITGVYEVLLSSVRGYMLEANQTELQQRLSGAMARLTWELTESDPSSYRVDASPPGIIFASPRDDSGTFRYDADGNLLWQKLVCYYVGDVNGVSALIRKEQALTAASSSPPPIPSSVTTSTFSASSVRTLWTAMNVDRLSITGGNPLDVTLGASKRASVADRRSTGIVDSLEVQGRVYLRN